MMVRPRVLGSNASNVGNAFMRRYPIYMQETELSKDEFDLELPPGYVADEIPPAVKKDVGFASYESSTTVDKNVIHYSRTYAMKEIEIPAKKVDDVRDFMSLISTDEHSNVILKKAQ